MKNIYLDDSYIRDYPDDSKSLINGIGGIIIDSSSEQQLIEIVKDEIEKYTHRNLPIKWNFKDSELNRIYSEFNKQDDYSNLIQNSRNIRLNIIRNSLDIDYSILFSCIKNYSHNKAIIKDKRELLTQSVFENILMRIGNEAKFNKDKYQVIMDWPPDSNPKPYNRAYYYMYNSKRTLTNNTNYCGKLCELNFGQSIYYTKSTHSTILQFTDIIIGSLKDYIEMCLNSKCDSCVGKEAFDIFSGKIRNFKNKRIGFGIIVSSGNKDLKTKLSEIFD